MPTTPSSVLNAHAAELAGHIRSAPRDLSRPERLKARCKSKLSKIRHSSQTWQLSPLAGQGWTFASATWRRYGFRIAADIP